MYKHYLSLLFLVLAGTAALPAQITLTADNYGVQDSVILLDSIYFDGRNVPDFPTAGENQTWDYSGLQVDSFYVNTYQEVPEDDTCFVGAQTLVPITFSFQAFSYPGFGYTSYEDSGRFDRGIKTDGAKFPLTAVTGSNQDTLAILPRVEAGRETLIPFPATYGTTSRDSFNLTASLELSVAAFGLNRTPAAQHYATTRTSEIIGYGDLILPAIPGAPSEPLEALLMKTTIVNAVTYTLAGGPAPPTLLQAFGARQNDTLTDVIYYFHVKGMGWSAARILVPGGQSTYEFQMRKVVPGTTTGVNRFSPKPISLYPNPVRPGESLFLTIPAEVSSGTMRLIDARGRVVTERMFRAYPGENIEFPIPPALKPGLYFQQVTDQAGQLMGIGKVMVN